jgi:Acetyltransferase (GNAT) domain
MIQGCGYVLATITKAPLAASRALLVEFIARKLRKLQLDIRIDPKGLDRAPSCFATDTHLVDTAKLSVNPRRSPPDNPPAKLNSRKRKTPDVELIIGWRDLMARAGSLDELLAATDAPPACRWTALNVWLGCHPEYEPCAVVVRSGDRLDAAIVLARRRHFGWWRIVRAGEPGEPGWLAARDSTAASALAHGLVSALKGLGRPWVLAISDLPSPCPAVDIVRLAIPGARIENGPFAPQVQFESGTPIHNYISSNTRSAVAKARNRIRRERTSHEIAWTHDANAIERYLPEIIQVHRARNIQLRGAAGIDEPRTAAKFIGMIRAHAARRQAWLLTVRIDSELAAFAVCLVAGGTMWVYTNLASPTWLRYSPGTIANAEVIRRAFADPTIHTVDWGAGVQRYKLSGQVTLRRSEHLRAWSSRTCWFAWAVRQWLRRIWVLPRPSRLTRRLIPRSPHI